MQSILDSRDRKQKPPKHQNSVIADTQFESDSCLSQDTHPASLPLDDLMVDCSIKRTRKSGPGGQHRNKVETAIVITHDPTGIVGQASENRSQHQNLELAVARLRINLAVAIRFDVAENAQPSELWVSRVISNKIQVNRNHPSFPALLAEALDFAAGSDYDLAAAARRLGISTSQLVKFFKTSTFAFEKVNRERKLRNLKRLS